MKKLRITLVSNGCSRAPDRPRLSACAPAWFIGLAGLVFALFAPLPGLCQTNVTIPGEESAGFFYTITHLHPAAYVVLFVIFVLSVVNLIYQGYFTGLRDPLAGRFGRGTRRGQSSLPGGAGSKAAASQAPVGRTPLTSASPGGGIPNIDAESGVVSAARPVAKDEPQSSEPTPLDGVNHPLPTFSADPGEHADGDDESHRKTKPVVPEFKFSAAVDVPTRDEIDRRDKEKLVVSGVVRDEAGRGIESVLVYLTDENGARVGQSSRSMAETGEFKVQANEPGRYWINGYKRGFVMASDEPPALPIQSGRIESFALEMIEERVVITGAVIFEDQPEPLPELEVRCVWGTDDSARSAKTDADGSFRIDAVPIETTCALELLDADGTVIAGSEPFGTGSKREIHRDIIVPASGGDARLNTGEADTAVEWTEKNPDIGSAPGAPPTSG